MALQTRVAVLESEVKSLRQTISELIAANTEPEPRVNPNGPRQMCPKCHEKPNYHLHVINCKGPSKKVVG